MACTGIEFCKLAIVETKERAIRLVEELEKRLADVHPDVPISIHLNGCPNACARTQVADIGLKGMIVTDADGNQVEGFQVHLGGGLGLDAGFGRKLRGLKVTSAELGDYVDRARAAVRRPARTRRAVRAVGRPGRRGRSEMSDERMSERAVPFYCPYCGEEDLRPAEQTERVPHGAWYCASCLRTFAVKMIGIGIPEVSR